MSKSIFRWSLWSPTPASVFMLSHSIGTVRAFFRDEATCVVHSDNVALVEANLLSPALVRDYSSHSRGQFCDPRSTWMKWAPCARLDANLPEVQLDADVFLVSEPEELRAFCQSPSNYRLLASQEEFVELWPYGTFGPQLPRPFVPINAGIVGQQAGADISLELLNLYETWRSRADRGEFLYHDEQGALALLLQSYCQRGEVLLLDAARYRVVCPLNSPPVETLVGIRGLHATYPEHPAFWRFLPEIAAVSGLSEELPSWRSSTG